MGMREQRMQGRIGMYCECCSRVCESVKLSELLSVLAEKTRKGVINYFVKLCGSSRSARKKIRERIVCLFCVCG